MKMKKRFAMIAMTMLLCVPATQSYAFSWSPMLNEMGILESLQNVTNGKLNILEALTGALGKKGTIIGETDRTRMGVNDVFRSVLAGSVGGALTSDPVLASLMNEQLNSKNAGSNAVITYINEKILGTVNDSLGKNVVFNLDNNGKVNVQTPVINKEFDDLFSSSGTLNKDVNLSKVNTSFENAEKSRQDYLFKQMNATQQRNKELMESNKEIMERVNKYNEQLKKDADKTKAYQQKLEQMSAQGAEESERNKLIAERDNQCLSEADIQRIQTAIASDMALININAAAMKANNESLKIMQESAKLQSEIDTTKRAKAEAEISRKSSRGFLEASIKTEGYDPSKKYSLFKD